jgi:hypothetical protein
MRQAAAAGAFSAQPLAAAANGVPVKGCHNALPCTHSPIRRRGHIGGMLGGAVVAWALGPRFLRDPATGRLEDRPPLPVLASSGNGGGFFRRARKGGRAEGDEGGGKARRKKGGDSDGGEEGVKQR